MSNMSHTDLYKEFVPRAESLELKELGLNEPCLACHPPHKLYLYSKTRGIKNSDKVSQDWICTAPTFLQAFRWFREKYGLFYFEDHRCNSKIDINSRTYWMGIKKFKLTSGSEVVVGLIQMGCFNTYEEAELACLRKLIEIVKNK